VLAFFAASCRRAPDPGAAEESKAPENGPAKPAAIAVSVAPLVRATVADVVSSPGKTAALAQQRVRPPFAGTLVELRVSDGDRVRRGDVLGEIVSRDSEAALAGAREMLRDARDAAEKADGERAVALAETSLVRADIRAPSDGAVLSHAAAKGDRVSEDQEIVTIADASSVVFLADVPQSDLAKVRRGQTARVELAGRGGALAGTVHDVLPGANPADFTVPVRIDLFGLSEIPPIGLYGTARITVGEHRDVLVAPEAAVVRDDLTGAARVAVVDGGRAHWVDVKTGARGPAGVEISAESLGPDRMLVVSGQVGLPEGAAVAPKP
jgi:multidrug efflux pump subunit AcrA (membrane-fusion protein)